MTNTTTCVVAAATMLAMANAARAQPRQPSIELGIYAPAAPFRSSDAARDHIEKLAESIGAATGRPVRARVFFRLQDLERARPHLAVLDARCIAARPRPIVLAVARVGKRTGQRWGLYGKRKLSVPSLKGDKLVYAPAGCADDLFLAHAVLGGELPLSFFGPRIARRTASLAAEAVRTKGIARAAFLPASAAAGLVLLFDAGPVPNAGLVALRPLTKSQRAAIVRGALAYRGTTAITGYRAGGGRAYRGLAARMKKRRKGFVLAPPTRYRLDTARMIQLPALPVPALSVIHHIQ